MSRRSILAGGCLVAVALIIGVWAWNAGEFLQFKPESGSSRSYRISHHVTLDSDDWYYPTTVKFSALVDAKITGIEQGLARLNISLPYVQISENDSTLFDSQELENESEAGLLLHRLLTTGVSAQVDVQGRQSGIQFVDAEAYASFRDYVSPHTMHQLESSIQLGQFYQPQLPTDRLKTGLVWHSEPFQANGVKFPALRHEVIGLNTELVTIQIAPAESVDASLEADYRGFLEIERATGWPVRGRFVTFQPADTRAGTPSIRTQLSLHQPGYEFKVRDMEFELWGHWSHNPMEIDLRDPDTRLYFLGEGLPVLSREQQLEMLQSSLLWLPPLDDLDHHGLVLDINAFLQSGITPRHIRHIRLLDENGNSVRDNIALDPRFDLYEALFHSYEDYFIRSPFHALNLTEEELDAIQHLELDLEFDTTATQLELQVDRQGKVEGVGSSEYQVDVLQWSTERTILRVSRKNEAPWSAGMLIPAVPLTAENQPLNQYLFRLSTSPVEKLRSTFKPRRSDTDEVDEYIRYLTDQLHPMPENQFTRDRIIEIQARERFDKVKLSILPQVEERQTLKVPNIVETIKGKSVVGSMRLSQHLLPDLEYSSLAMEEIKTSGTRNGQLLFTLPKHGQNRCTFGMIQPLEVAGSPLLVKQQPSGWFYGDSETIELLLATEHGLEFFYDLNVTLQAHCITQIEARTESVDGSTQLRRIDPYTIELSEKLFADISRINELKNGIAATYPLIGRDKSDQPLVILSHLDFYQGEDAGESRRIRFWGEVDEITYPVIKTMESRQFEARFPPLP